MTLEINPVVRRAYEAANQVVSAHCDLLYQCDLDCEHCYLDDKKRHILPTAFWKDVFDQLADLGVLVLLISGGEAFLRKDLFELLDHAKAQGLLVALNTHGGWLTESSAQRLRQTSVFQVQLSYYSHRPEVHDAVTRRVGSHAKTIAGINHLVQAGVKVKLNITLMERNAADEAGIRAQFASQPNVELVFSRDMLSALSGDDFPRQLGLKGEALERSLNGDPELSIAAPSSCSPLSAGDGWAEGSLCGAGRSSLYIDPEGKVTPCLNWPMAVGDLRNGERLKDLWRDSKHLQDIRGTSNADRDACGGCAGRQTCSYCPGQAYLETGDYTQPSTYACTSNHAKRRVAYQNAGLEPPEAPPGLRKRRGFTILSATQAAEARG